MSAQSLYFIGDHGVRVEFDIDSEGERMFSLTSSFNPRRDPDLIICATTDELADEIQQRVMDHFIEYQSPLRLIRTRQNLKFVRLDHLTRYGVPIVPQDTGEHPE